MQQTKNSIQEVDTSEVFSFTGDDFSEGLRNQEIGYTITGFHLQVGEISKVQGWILDLSVVKYQLLQFLNEVVPYLISEKVAFKIPADYETYCNIINGGLGIENLGKVVSIYPETDLVALNLSKRLIEFTVNYKGPAIPTDIFLGSIVYTRYGAFNPIQVYDKSGRPENFIYNFENKLVKDACDSTFVLPKGIRWPFSDLANPVGKVQKETLAHLYKLISVLKTDIKGNVYEGIYLKGFLNVKKCVIKQGNKNAAADEYGRDILDRLLWQKELYDVLHDTIPLPKIIDLFQEDGDSYLVMELIKGISLYKVRKQMHLNSSGWKDLTREEAIRLLDYLITISDIVSALHKKGYVHRDIAPENFLINDKGSIYLIDVELAYSYLENVPEPPFDFGTPGFMSPNQLALGIPCTQDDIYGIGALMISVLTGISPARFTTYDQGRLSQAMNALIGNQELSNMVTSCLDHDPLSRPDLQTIRQVLNKYKQELIQGSHNDKGHLVPDNVSTDELNDLITAALKGLSREPMVILNDVWYSKAINTEEGRESQHREYTRLPGFFEGIGGVLYLIAKAKRLGLNTSQLLKGYVKGWEFIEETLSKPTAEIIPGLYRGSAGICLALNEGIQSGLLEDNAQNRKKIYNYLEVPLHELNLSEGIAGKGVAMLQCAGYLDRTYWKNSLNNIVNSLLSAQNNNGSWSTSSNSIEKKSFQQMSFANGTIGITWFLLHAALFDENNSKKISDAATKSLTWILKNTNDLNDLFTSTFKNDLLGGHESGDERKGVILTLIKAYETLKKEHYKEIAQSALLKYPSHIVKTDFSQSTGLSGLGEMYIEAWKVFKNDEWKHRADWIKNIFYHTFHGHEEGSGYWMMEENSNPTADFMIGNGGIIHFLLRCLYPEKVGYRLLY